MCDDVDADIWGDGYKLVMKRIKGFPPKPQLTMAAMQEIVHHLFPTHEETTFHCDRSESPLHFAPEELQAACKKLKCNKAPGPGCIPSEVLRQTATEKPEYTLAVYNRLATATIFPAEWKEATLVLLRKGDKPLDNPASYRPLCLLDVEGKLYEQLISIKLKDELHRTGGLSDRQFGFREGRQTVDAIKEVMKIASEAAKYTAAYRRLCAVITLDVQNAFNSASWALILEELRKRRIDNDLLCVIASYLSNRRILLEAEGTTETVKITSGVPQGSVLGPTLWNVLYDELLRIEFPGEVTLIGFADDIAMVVTAKNEETLMNTANAGLLRVARWMKSKKLHLAPQKTEAVILGKQRKIAPITFDVEGTTIIPSRAIKYLGVWLDSKLTFVEQVDRAILKAEKTVTALSSIMPNLRGARASKRRILASVVHSQLLYGAPAWHTAVDSKRLVQRLSRVQRKVNIRVCSAYRTISAEGVAVIAGIPPIELQVKERVEVYNGTARNTAREHLIAKWQQKWDSGRYGRWTWQLIPNIQRWLHKKQGEVDYFLTQALSGHGCFRKYLFERRRADSNICTYCENTDDVEHTLFLCSRWEEVRAAFQRNTGKVFNAKNMMDGLTGTETSWKNTYDAIRQIIETKEKESR